MKNQGRYRHLRVDWVGESCSKSITLCGVEGEDIGAGQALCSDCAQVADALHVCGLGPESLRELFDTLRVIGPSEGRCCMIQLRREWGRFSNFSFRAPQRRIAAYLARPSG